VVLIFFYGLILTPVKITAVLKSIDTMKKIKQQKDQNTSKQDNLYSQPREAISGFVFDENVVDVFEDMIGRSVPGYTTLLSMFPVLARSFVTHDSYCYDLGCSLGAATLALQQGIDQDNVEVFAVDNSPAMIKKCRYITAQHSSRAKVTVEEADICDYPIRNASLVVMNFTLQFVSMNARSALIGNIFTGLNPGGAFVLSEKIIFEDEQEQNRLISLHHDFKKANGYSDLEISQKRSSLDNVLIAETVAEHKTRLKQAGFSEVVVWFQCFNFVSILAIK